MHEVWSASSPVEVVFLRPLPNPLARSKDPRDVTTVGKGNRNKTKPALQCSIGVTMFLLDMFQNHEQNSRVNGQMYDLGLLLHNCGTFFRFTFQTWSEMSGDTEETPACIQLGLGSADVSKTLDAASSSGSWGSYSLCSMSGKVKRG